MDEQKRYSWIQVGTIVDYHSIIGGPITKAAMVVREPCIYCGDGTAHVVTTRMGAAYEQGLALGMTRADAWKRAKRVGP